MHVGSLSEGAPGSGSTQAPGLPRPRVLPQGSHRGLTSRLSQTGLHRVTFRPLGGDGPGFNLASARATCSDQASLKLATEAFPGDRKVRSSKRGQSSTSGACPAHIPPPSTLSGVQKGRPIGIFKYRNQLFSNIASGNENLVPGKLNFSSRELNV